ncbi:PAS domain-containing hybrid sensor histidine kinase/response regulator [Hydrogenophaga sp. BPS33]|uniref:PAS domain-containing hybrid sensor histidine kinase/response regulator n=1 Tax=Hydrogenophaga sp. BPS33 TaxID=2651974 RepID=UPI001358334F|nr:ATP-binding protein [Hydrogenophaga sp. BPS33]
MTAATWLQTLAGPSRDALLSALKHPHDFELHLECLGAEDGGSAWLACTAWWSPEHGHHTCFLADVSAAEDARRAAQGFSQRLRMLFEHVPMMVAYFGPRPGARCLFANQQFAEMLGWDERSILDRSARRVVGRALLREVFQNARPLFQQRLTVVFQCSAKAPDGHCKRLEVTMVPDIGAGGHVIGTHVLMTDVTDAHLAEAALRESQDRLSKFMEASTEGVLFHRDGVITDANPAACKLYGADLSSLLGKSIFDFVTPDHLGTALRTVALPTDARLESEIVTAQGERIPVEVIGRSLLRFGEQLSMVILRDIRDRRQAQVRIQELIMGLRTEKDRAEGADRAKSVFLAAASHDLRQPIHALGLFLTALRSMAQAPSVPAAELGLICRRMQASLDGLGQLLNMLLDVSRLDANAVEVTRGPSSLAQLLAELDQEFQPLAQEKGLRLRMVDSALWVHTDLTVLRRILANLLSNAVRYTHRGRILLVCRSRAQEVEIQVWDQGIGIADEQREAIFEEFYQIGPSTARNHESHGMGLGLSIVKRSAQLLQAPLQVRSQPGHGSMFSIRLPRCEAPAQALGTASEPAYARTANSRGVLVIDDDAQVLHAMHSVLTAWGHRVFCAHSPDEAVLMAAQHGTQIDVLISDYRLGGVVTAVETIQAVHTCLQREIPTYILTGDTSPQRIQEASILGFPLVHKPVDAHTLRAVMMDAALS